MAVTLSQTGESSRILLDGVIDIACAGELKAALLKAIAAGKEIVISVEAAADMDVTAFQLLWAGKRAARQKGFALRVAGKLPESIQSFFSSVGLSLTFDTSDGVAGDPPERSIGAQKVA